MHRYFILKHKPFSCLCYVQDIHVVGAQNFSEKLIMQEINISLSSYGEDGGLDHISQFTINSQL